LPKDNSQPGGYEYRSLQRSNLTDNIFAPGIIAGPGWLLAAFLIN
jgi:hypothetical protein